MSRDKLERVRRSYEAFNRRELDAALDAFRDDAEWVPYLAALESERYRGRDEIRAMWQEMLQALPDLRLESVDLVGERGDVIVVAVEFHGMGRTSGAGATATIFQAITFRDGEAVLVQGFGTREEALDAVGLTE